MGEEKNLLEIIRRKFQSAANDHDLEKLMGLFDPEAKFHIDGHKPLIGKTQIRSIFEYDSGVNGGLEFINCTREGNKIKCQLLERNDRLKAFGIDKLFYPYCVFTFKDDLITEFIAIRDSQTVQVQQKLWPKFRQWIQERYPEDNAKLFDKEGGFIRNFENGRRSAQLLKEWNASKKL